MHYIRTPSQRHPNQNPTNTMDQGEPRCAIQYTHTDWLLHTHERMHLRESYDIPTPQWPGPSGIFENDDEGPDAMYIAWDVPPPPSYFDTATHDAFQVCSYPTPSTQIQEEEIFKSQSNTIQPPQDSLKSPDDNLKLSSSPVRTLLDSFKLPAVPIQAQNDTPGKNTNTTTHKKHDTHKRIHTLMSSKTGCFKHSPKMEHNGNVCKMFTLGVIGIDRICMSKYEMDNIYKSKEHTKRALSNFVQQMLPTQPQMLNMQTTSSPSEQPIVQKQKSTENSKVQHKRVAEHRSPKPTTSKQTSTQESTPPKRRHSERNLVHMRHAEKKLNGRTCRYMNPDERREYEAVMLECTAKTGLEHLQLLHWLQNRRKPSRIAAAMVRAANDKQT